MQVQAAGELERYLASTKLTLTTGLKKRLRYRKLITIGYWGYVNIVYPGKHIRNIHDKSDTFTVEGIKALTYGIISRFCDAEADAFPEQSKR